MRRTFITSVLAIGALLATSRANVIHEFHRSNPWHSWHGWNGWHGWHPGW